MKKNLIILSLISLLAVFTSSFSAHAPANIVSWQQELETQKDSAQQLIDLIAQEGVNPQIIRKARKIEKYTKDSLEHLPEIEDTQMQAAEDMLQNAIANYNERNFDAAKVALKEFCKAIMGIEEKPHVIASTNMPPTNRAWEIEFKNLIMFADSLKNEVDKDGIDPRKVKDAKIILEQILKGQKYLPQILPREIEIARNELKAVIGLYNANELDASAAALKIFCRSIMRLGTEESQEVARSVPRPQK